MTDHPTRQEPTLAQIRVGWQKFSAWKRVPSVGFEAAGAEFDAAIRTALSNLVADEVEQIASEHRPACGDHLHLIAAAIRSGDREVGK